MLTPNLILIILIFLSLVVVLIILRARTPIFSVLFLLVLFILAATILLLTTNEFLAFVYIIVYIGAVIVLLLWVVMTIPVKPTYELSPGLVTAFLLFSTFLILSIFTVMFIVSVPTIAVFTIDYSDDLFNVFWTVYCNHVLIDDYSNFIQQLHVHSVNGVVLPVNTGVHLTPKGEALFVKVLAGVYTKHQLVNTYFPVNFSQNSLLWKELMSTYYNLSDVQPLPLFAKQLLFSHKLSQLITANTIILPYYKFLVHTLSLKCLELTIDTVSLYSASATTPFHIFVELVGLPPKVIYFYNFTDYRLLDWLYFLRWYSPNLITSLAIALYIYYGHGLLIVAMILLSAMVGVILIVRLPNLSDYLGSSQHYKNNGHY